MRTKASLSLEAALVFPFFVLMLALLLSFFKGMVGAVMIRAALYDAADRMAAYATLYEVACLDRISEKISEETENEENLAETLAAHVSAQAYRLLLNAAGAGIARELMTEQLDWVELEAFGVCDGIRGLDFSETKMLCADGERSALIELVVTYRPLLIMDIKGLELPKVKLTVLTQAFLGKNPFAAETKPNVVYSIGDGECYHKLRCFIIDKTISELSLGQAMAAGFRACSRCHPIEQDKVYVTDGGECFHSMGCSYLYPGLYALSPEEAEERGLVPCELCFTDQVYFR